VSQPGRQPPRLGPRFDPGSFDLPPTLHTDPRSNSVFPPGTNVVKCRAIDASGNRSTCEFTVTVRPPVLPR